MELNLTWDHLTGPMIVQIMWVDQLRYKRMHKVKDEKELWSLIYFIVIKISV